MLKQTYNEHLEEVLSDIRLIYMHLIYASLKMRI